MMNDEEACRDGVGCGRWAVLHCPVGSERRTKGRG